MTFCCRLGEIIKLPIITLKLWTSFFERTVITNLYSSGFLQEQSLTTFKVNFSVV